MNDPWAWGLAFLLGVIVGLQNRYALALNAVSASRLSCGSAWDRAYGLSNGDPQQLE